MHPRSHQNANLASPTDSRHTHSGELLSDDNLTSTSKPSSPQMLPGSITEAARRNSRNAAGLCIQTSNNSNTQMHTLATLAVEQQQQMQLQQQLASSKMAPPARPPASASSKQSRLVPRPPASATLLSPRPIEPTSSGAAMPPRHPSINNVVNDFNAMPRSPLHAHPPPSPLYATHPPGIPAAIAVPMTPTITTMPATGFPVSRQSFMSIFETMYDQVEPNARLRSTLEEQLRSSARLLATLQASGAMIESLVRTQFREMQLLYGEKFGAALIDLNRRLSRIEEHCGLEAGNLIMGGHPVSNDSMPIVTRSSTDREPPQPSASTQASGHVGGLVGHVNASTAEEDMRALSQRLDVAEKKSGSNSRSPLPRFA